MMFPKPGRPKRHHVESTFAKTGRIIDESLLADVREAACCVKGCPCKADAAHIRVRRAGGDIPSNVMPLCKSHHELEQHIVGWPTFLKRHPEVRSWAEIMADPELAERLGVAHLIEKYRDRAV